MIDFNTPNFVEEPEEETYDDTYELIIMCYKCHHELDTKYDACPYCGARLIWDFEEE